MLLAALEHYDTCGHLPESLAFYLGRASFDERIDLWQRFTAQQLDALNKWLLAIPLLHPEDFESEDVAEALANVDAALSVAVDRQESSR